MNKFESKFEEYTFPQLLREYDRIVIPMIQRDYAQGREDVKATDIRGKIVKAILSGTAHLDLVYGMKEERQLVYGSENRECGQTKKLMCFVPIDGQQRLTTLFLVCLYALKTGKLPDGYSQDELSKFTYDTRRAARDFCTAVVGEKWTKVSEIMDATWFMDYWKNDPTVAGMLMTLKTIEKESANFDRDKLKDIKFYLFDMGEYGQSDDLYLKMNSRGKPLTPFENLKANIDEILPENGDVDSFIESQEDVHVSGSDFKSKWQYHIDRDWMNVFWNPDSPEKLDDHLIAFILRFVAGVYAVQPELVCDEKKDIREKTSNYLKGLCSKDSYSDYLSFDKLAPIFTGDDGKKVFERLAKAFSIVSRSITMLTPCWAKDKNEKFSSDKMTEYKFLSVLMARLLLGESEDVLRFAWNMAENTVNDYDGYISFCDRLSEIKNDNSFANSGLYSTLVKHKFQMPSAQLKEEIEKAKLILQDKDGESDTWESRIRDLESHGYFKGQIRFMANLIDSTANDDSKSWNTWSKEEFSKYSRIMESLFNENGLRSDIDIDFHRALMCFTKYYGYGYPIGGKWGLLQNFSDHNDTWKYFISDRDEQNNFNGCFKKLVDEIIKRSEEVNSEKVNKEMLEGIINNQRNFIEDLHNEETEWRTWFIDYPRVWKFMQKRRMEWYENVNEILIFKNERRSGEHHSLVNFCQSENALS